MVAALAPAWPATATATAATATATAAAAAASGRTLAFASERTTPPRRMARAARPHYGQARATLFAALQALTSARTGGRRPPTRPHRRAHVTPPPALGARADRRLRSRRACGRVSTAHATCPGLPGRTLLAVPVVRSPVLTGKLAPPCPFDAPRRSARPCGLMHGTRRRGGGGHRRRRRPRRRRRLRSRRRCCGGGWRGMAWRWGTRLRDAAPLSSRSARAAPIARACSPARCGRVLPRGRDRALAPHTNTDSLAINAQTAPVESCRSTSVHARPHTRARTPQTTEEWRHSVRLVVRQRFVFTSQKRLAP